MAIPNTLGFFHLLHWSAWILIPALIGLGIFWKKYRDSQM